jgi:hypothetical protein
VSFYSSLLSKHFLLLLYPLEKSNQLRSSDDCYMAWRSNSTGLLHSVMDWFELSVRTYHLRRSLAERPGLEMRSNDHTRGVQLFVTCDVI